MIIPTKPSSEPHTDRLSNIHAGPMPVTSPMMAHEGTLSSIANAYQAEEQINVLRNELREAEIEALEDNDKNYQTSVYYIDIINELEHMGDYMINISQSLERAFVGK